MKELSLNDALKLYEVLKDYIPEQYDPNDAFHFASIIVKNIKESKNYRDYLRALMIMTGYEKDAILKNTDAMEAVRIFMDGIVVNQVPMLVEYCRKIGY